MSRMLLSFLAVAAIACASATASAQETKTTTTTTTQKTQTIQHADGSYTVIEYPADREVTVELTPSHTIHGAKGLAKVLRRADGTTIALDLSGLPTDVASVNLFAVDPMGQFTLLGPVTISNGVATQTFTTPMDKFMLVLSPEQQLSALADTTPVFFRSAVPQGLSVVPVTRVNDEKMRAVGEQVSAGATSQTTAVAPDGTKITTTTVTNSDYNVPMLGLPTFKRGDDSLIKVKLGGEMTGARANFRLLPRKDGPTIIEARFHELKEAPAGRRYVLWAVSPENKFVKLGQFINTGGRNEAEIKSETTLPDFGLFITTEEPSDTIMSPTGPVVATIYK